jgi:hypothetical protein
MRCTASRLEDDACDVDLAFSDAERDVVVAAGILQPSQAAILPPTLVG